MDASPFFELNGQEAVFRPPAHVSFEQAVAWVTSAILLARQQGVRKLLVLATEWTGFSPDEVDRYHFATEWARAAAGSVRLAMVVQPSIADPEKFGVTVARNRGLISDVFTSEAEARDWLRDGAG